MILHSLNEILRQLPHFLAQSRSKTAHEVVGEESAGANGAFDNATEHPECKHIEEKVAQSAVEEHISDRLPKVEIISQYKMKPQPTGEIDNPCLLKHRLRQQNDTIDDEQVF